MSLLFVVGDDENGLVSIVHVHVFAQLKSDCLLDLFEVGEDLRSDAFYSLRGATRVSDQTSRPYH